MSENKGNMELWNSVCETDPAITKLFGDKHKMTSICAQSQIKTATELWGPMGQAWGVKDEKYEILGAYCIYTAALFYPTGSLLIHADIEIIFSSGEKQKGRYNDDFTKKIATDALTKGLSRLGFNSDIFEGKFDDNKYVAEQRAKHAQKGSGKVTTTETTKPPPPVTEEKKKVDEPPKATGRFRQHIVADIVSVLTDKVFTDEERTGIKVEISLRKSNIALEALLATWQSEQNKRIEDFEDDNPMPAEEEKAIEEATASLFPEEEKAIQEKADREAIETPDIF